MFKLESRTSTIPFAGDSSLFSFQSPMYSKPILYETLLSQESPEEMIERMRASLEDYKVE